MEELAVEGEYSRVTGDTKIPNGFTGFSFVCSSVACFCGSVTESIFKKNLTEDDAAVYTGI